MSRNTASLWNRRELARGAGALGIGLVLGKRGWAATTPKGKPAGKKPAGIAVGYAAITWGDKSVKTAIEEIAAAGYPGIQLRRTILDEYKEPAVLKADLDRLKLTFACVSGGGPSADPAKRQEEVDKFMTLARFAREAGALAIQATSPNRNGRPTIDPAELKAFAETLTEIGKRCSEVGLPLAFHPHMNQIGETADEVNAIMGAADPKHVRLLLDTGHWAAAGGDPVKAVKDHIKRIEVLHIKDVKDRSPAPGAVGKDGKPDTKKYEFVELGQGKVDFKGVFKALRGGGFRGWAVVELDTVPEGRAPKDAALANRDFLTKNVGLKV
jgi:inosose dehydratase